MTLSQLLHIFRTENIPDDVDVHVCSTCTERVDGVVYVPAEAAVYLCDDTDTCVQIIVESYHDSGLRAPEYVVLSPL